MGVVAPLRPRAAAAFACPLARAGEVTSWR
jgi:hypothetical protein